MAEPQLTIRQPQIRAGLPQEAAKVDLDQLQDCSIDELNAVLESLRVEREKVREVARKVAAIRNKKIYAQQAVLRDGEKEVRRQERVGLRPEGTADEGVKQVKAAGVESALTRKVPNG